VRLRFHFLIVCLILWQASGVYAGDTTLDASAASNHPVASVNASDSNATRQANSSKPVGENNSEHGISGNDGAVAQFPLTAEDLVYGEYQVERMIHDRPEMSKPVQKGDPVWTWAVRQFAGDYTGSRFAWNAKPEGDFTSRSLPDACFMYPHSGQPGWITVNPVMRHAHFGVWTDTGERMWAAVIFELFNIRNWQPLSDSVQMAYAGTISRDEYIHTVTLHEYKALQQRVVFYNTVWRSTHPAMTSDSEFDLGYRTLPKHVRPLGSFLKAQDDPWYSHVPATYEKWFNSYGKDSDYLCNYGRSYDRYTKWRRPLLDTMKHELPQPYGDFAKPNGEPIRASDIM